MPLVEVPLESTRSQFFSSILRLSQTFPAILLLGALTLCTRARIDGRDRHKQAELIEAVTLGQDPKVASEKIRELLGTENAASKRKNHSKRKRNRKRSS